MSYTFNDQETVKVLQDNLDLIIREDNAPEAFLFAKKLEELLNDQKLTNDLSKENFLVYHEMLRQAKFVSLYKQDEEEIIELFSKYFNEIFNIKFYNILDKVDDYLSVNIYLIKERDVFKEKLRKSLLENKIKITREEIEINNQKVSPIIANWLRDFRNSFMEKGFVDSVNITKYITGNKNFLSLNKKEQRKIKTLLNLYAHLKVSSASPEGIEEHISVETEDGESVILANGQIEKIPQMAIDIFNEVQRKTGGELYDPNKKQESRNKVSTSSSQKVFTLPEESKKEEKDVPEKSNQKSVEKLLESYRAFEIDLKSIDSLIKELDKYKNSPDGLFKKFSQDLKAESRDALLSSLIFICQNKLLDKFLKENEELLSEFKKHLSFKLSDDVIQSIMKKSTSPETVSLYLQFLLFKKIKLNQQNAGLFGMHLANIFKKNGQDKYFPMVYGDLNLERFVWRDVIEENGLVKFK